VNTRDIQERIAQIRKEHYENGGDGIVCLTIHLWHDRLAYTAHYDRKCENFAPGPVRAALQWIEGQHAAFMAARGKTPPEPPIEIIDPKPAEA
jgi:hypothetical protein